MNQEKKVVKISDVVQNQIPEFILSENPNFVEFLKQYYVSQEFQGSSVDLAENLISYKNLDSFDLTNLIEETTLSSNVGYFDEVINVSSTAGWPNQYGLLKIGDEIITYTGITSTSFTGCIRGFSGISSLTQQNNPEVLVFSQTEATTHTKNTTVHNLSNLFLKEFFKKIKYQFTPGFEELDFAPQINPQNFISKAKSFYQTKGTDEAFKILFKVLYAEDVKVIKPDDYCFTPSDNKWRVVETLICDLVSGNPFNLDGQTLYQDTFPQYGIQKANGSIYNVESFKSDGETFYKLQLFSGYSNNLNPKGSIEGTFSTTPKTFVVEDIASGSTVITVDSTIGFANTGTLVINNLNIKYTDKTNNQFRNCVGIGASIARKSKVFSDHYLYAYENNSQNVVKFKLNNVLSKLDSSNVLYAYDGDPIEINHLGSTEQSTFLSSLIYNKPISVNCGEAVNSITPQIRNNQKEGFSISDGKVLCLYKHYLRTKDIVDLYIENTNQLVASNLTVSVINPKEFVIPISAVSGQYSNLNSLLNKRIVFKRTIKKSTYQNLGLTANIQDSYLDSNYYYLTSNGLPEYQINPFILNKTFSKNSFYSLTCSGNHYFENGDEVSVVGYTITRGFKNSIGISTGNSYYIRKNTGTEISLCQSKENVGLSSFIPLIEYDVKGNVSGEVGTITFIPKSQYNQSFGSNKIFKKFKQSTSPSTSKDNTSAGNIGIFANGIELRNYKSFDKVYYGPVESVTVLNSGSNYNITNPPRFKVSYDGVETSLTTIIPHLKGKLTNLFVINPGYDYIETPTVNISGGNNDSVVTEVKMKNIINEVEFNATTKDTIINTVDSTFNFNSKHRFVTGEPVIYKTFGSTPIGIGTDVADGTLTDNSIYYVVNIGAGTSMSLAFNKNDALLGTNSINLRTYGGGLQSFISTIPKKGIDEVNILQNEKNFEYKKVSFNYLNVDGQNNVITIENHGFSTGEEIVYSWEPVSGYNGSSIGLSTTAYYYIVKLDENKFKLSSTKNSINYVNFSRGEEYSIYYFEYSPVRIQISGSLSVSGISTIGYGASIVPLIQGSVVSADVQKRPNSPNVVLDNFGEKNILNYEKSPTIEAIEGEGAVFQPLIVDGKIKQVIVKTFGTGYFNTFNLIVSGDGFGAKLSPIISNGSIIDVQVVNGGVGYNSTNTNIDIVPVGTGVMLKANLPSWTLNEVEKYGLSNVEDGRIFGTGYALNKNTFGVYFLNKKLRDFFNISSTSHSPIVGWSYDGCPIYGPFGYTNPDGSGGISRMRSGYSYQNSIDSDFKFVEEYVFNDSGTLDKYNGRFCITPEYPKGVYAYFCTLNNNNVPQFPYVIGPQYNCSVVEENLNLRINQNLNFNNLDIIKWTSPYRVEDLYSKYEYFEYIKNPNKNDILVEKSSTGFVDEIKIIEGGFDYQVNDSILFDDKNTSGFGAAARVSEVFGVEVKSISNQTISFSDVTFTSDGNNIVGIVSTYHSFDDSSYINISGISTTSFKPIEGFRKINVSNIVTKLTSNLGPSTITGIVTSIQVAESIWSFEINSQWSISDEVVKVVGLDYKNNFINILRPSNASSHAAKELVTLLPNKFNFSANNLVSPYLNNNESYYFDSQQSVSIGTTIGVGFGNVLTIYPLGIGVSYVKYVPTGGIYLPNHKFNTGDKIIYTPGTSTIITNYGDLSNFSELYVLKLDSDSIGVVTSKSNLSNQNKILTYTFTGTGNLHNFTTDKQIITGTITKNNCVVSTASTHGLSVGDAIDLNVKPGIAITFAVTYANNRVLINSQVNPEIDVYSNDIISFDLSDSSMSGRTFDLYTDENFLNPYTGNSKNGIEVKKSSTLLTLTISDFTPKNLFYNVIGANTNISINNYNQINIKTSKYNTQTFVTSKNDYDFTINLNNTPEELTYTSGTSTLSYSVLNKGVLGPIYRVELLSKGSGYKKLPKVESVISRYGNGSNLFANSQSIGKIEKTKVNNTQFICPTDKTLKPESKVFSAIKLTDNYKVDSLNIVYGGKNYIFEPKIQLYNSKSDEIISNFSAVAYLKNSSIDRVEIVNPGNGLKSTDNKIIVTDNTNGFGIIDASVSGSSPYTVTLTLKTPTSGFTTSNPLPISVGDKIFVEGISAIGNGFNSSDYKYEPFVVTFVNPAYGSQDAAVIKYELNTNPGSYNNTSTYKAVVIPYSYIPRIKASLIQNDFYNNEGVDDTEIIDNNKNNPIENILKVKDSSGINVDDIISGKSSNSKGRVIDVDNFISTFSIDYGVSETLGGIENRSYLSSNVQKLSDNDYYQKFSYSLKSKNQYDTWNSPVSDIAHITGYKKFSDLSVESVGIGTTESIKTNSTSTLNVILNSYTNVNTIADYDLVNEIDVDDTNRIYTQDLKFKRLKFGSSLKSTNNRVLSIDDISSLFTTEPISPSIVLDSIFTSESSTLKYEFYLTATDSFFGDFVNPEIFELFITKTFNNVNLVSYSNYFPFNKANPFLGNFSADLNPTNNSEIILTFTPTNPFLSVDIKSIKEIAPNSVGIATTSFGYVKNVELCEKYDVNVGVQTFYSIPISSCNSGTLIIGISSSFGNIERSFESSFINTTNDILINNYAENTLNNLGSVNIVKNGSNIDFTYTGVAGIGVTLSANIKLLTSNYAGYDSIIKTLSKLSSSKITTNSSSTGISTISGIYGYTKYVMCIEQDTGISTQRSIVQLNSIHAGDHLNNIMYDMTGNIDQSELNFETTYNISGNNYTLYFNPITSANYTITIFESSLLSPNQ